MATASWADGIANSRRGSTEKEGGDKGEEILDARARHAWFLVVVFRVSSGSVHESEISINRLDISPS